MKCSEQVRIISYLLFTGIQMLFLLCFECFWLVDINS